MEYYEELKRGKSVPICNNMDKFHKYNVEPKKSVTRMHILYDSIDKNYKNRES